MAFPLLAAFLFIVIVLAIIYRNSDKKTEQSRQDFFEREQKANATLAKDLSDLEYITIPLEKFPIRKFDSEEIRQCEEVLSSLSAEKIFKSSHMTNTEIKETYGAPNLTVISDMGERFDLLTKTLVDYATAVNEFDPVSAIAILEYGVVIHSDISKNYTLLADYYNDCNQKRKIEALRTQVEAMDSIMKPSILRHLDSLI